MKRIAYLFIVLTMVQACMISPKPEVVDNIFESSDEELFATCADLQGIGQFVIGKTKFKDVLKDKSYTDAIMPLLRHSTLYNGYWGYKFWKGNDSFDEKDLDKSEWIEDQVKGKIKQLYCDYSGFSVGELEFDRFDMAFLNDTLVSIFFYPDMKNEKVIIDHYKEKYGDGRGHYKYFHQTNGSTEIKRLEATTSTDEKRTWENDKVALEYVNEEYFHCEPGKEPSSYHERSMIIYNKSRYPVFEKTLRDYAKQYDEIMENNKNKVLNTL